ncbi:preprotein translocase subunit SecG, partial [Fusobacterium sp.]
MESILTVLLFIFALALIVLVLIQPDRSHGMSGSMG